MAIIENFIPLPTVPLSVEYTAFTVRNFMNNAGELYPSANIVLHYELWLEQRPALQRLALIRALQAKKGLMMTNEETAQYLKLVPKSA